MTVQNNSQAPAHQALAQQASTLQEPMQSVQRPAKKFFEMTLAHTTQFITAQFKGNAVGAEKQTSEDTQKQMDKAKENMPMDIYAVMALVQRTAQEMRNTNRELRASALDTQVGELLNAADDIKKAANFKFAAAMVQASFQIAGGAVQLGTSIASGQKAASAAKAQNQSDHFKDMSKSFGKGSVFREAAGDESSRLASVAKGFNHQADQINAGGRITGEFTAGVGGAIAAGLNFAASRAEVDAKRHEAAAKLHESATAEANDMMQQMMEVIRDIKDKVSAMDQSRIETNRAISRNI